MDAPPASLSQCTNDPSAIGEPEEDNPLPQTIECYKCSRSYTTESIDLTPQVFNSIQAAHGRFCYSNPCLLCSNAKDRHATCLSVQSCSLKSITNKDNTYKNKIPKLLDIKTNPPSVSALSKSPSLTAFVLSLLPTSPPPFYIAYLPTISLNHRRTNKFKQLLKETNDPSISADSGDCKPKTGQAANVNKRREKLIDDSSTILISGQIVIGQFHQNMQFVLTNADITARPQTIQNPDYSALIMHND